MIRNDWLREEVREIFHSPLLTLIRRASQVHEKYNDPNEVQVCALLSIKTGGCPEDCRYCAQSSYYQTGLTPEKMLEHSEVVEFAKKAKEMGATRVCLGSSGRDVKDNAQFEKVCKMVSSVKEMGLEVCCTLGMMKEDVAHKLKEAGCYAYNHNLDTSREHYPNITTTRTYDDRLETIDTVRKAEMTVCCGGILGMGETEEDRVSLLHTLATLDPHPESVPVNFLVPISGTPFSQYLRLSVWDMTRAIATARILMPKTMVRLSAGRGSISKEEQALCFLAGANSIFYGEKLLTVPNATRSEDDEMFEVLGLVKRPAFKREEEEATCSLS